MTIKEWFSDYIGSGSDQEMAQDKITPEEFDTLIENIFEICDTCCHEHGKPYGPCHNCVGNSELNFMRKGWINE